MSLLPEQATFEELVQECFLAFRGSGLMLSALDAELVARWAERNVPYEVVARGIRRAAERAAWDARPGEPLLRSLRACRHPVEQEIEKYLARAAGRGPQEAAGGAHEPFDVGRHRKLRATLKELATQRPELAYVIGALKSGILARPPQSMEEAAGRADAVAVRLLRALPFPERLSVLREARARMADVRMSFRARKLGLRFHRSQSLSQRLGLR